MKPKIALRAIMSKASSIVRTVKIPKRLFQRALQGTPLPQNCCNFDKLFFNICRNILHT